VDDAHHGGVGTAVYGQVSAMVRIVRAEIVLRPHGSSVIPDAASAASRNPVSLKAAGFPLSRE